MKRHQLLAGLHRLLQPRSYLETGIQRGASLRLSRVPSIGIDPEFAIDHELATSVHLVRAASDEFFARERPLAHLPEPVLDLAFVDGMHLAEYALRDLVAIERFTTPGSVILLDDMLPLDVPMANRVRTSSGMWTGDVYKVTEALHTLRPDLLVLEVDTAVTGTVVVLCPDASRGGVLDGYDDWLEATVVPDPQPVPASVLDRHAAVDPQALLDCPGWATVIAMRDRSCAEAAPLIRQAFAKFWKA